MSLTEEGPLTARLTTLAPIPRPAWLSEQVWPFATSQLDVGSSSLAVTDVGQGPVLLFVHTGFWSFIWRDVMTPLAPDFRCICFDAPGTGQSARVAPEAVTLESAARAAAHVIERLGLEQVTLVVHDLGGPSGLAGAALTPERIRGIAAVNAFGWHPTGAAFRGMLALVGSAALREFDVLTDLLPRVTSTTFGVGRHLDATSRRAFRAGIGREGVRSFHRYLRDARHSDALYERVAGALGGAFKELPLLTIFGERNDPLGFQARWKALFPNAQQVIVPRGNHFPMCDAPDLVAETIRTWHRERVAVEAWR